MVGVGVVVVVGGFAVLSLYGHLAFGWGEIFTILATIFWALHILGVAYGSNRLGTLAFVQLQLTTCAVLSLAGSFAFERPTLFPGWQAIGRHLLDRHHGEPRGLRADGRGPAPHSADAGRGHHEPRSGLRADLLDHRRLRHASPGGRLLGFALVFAGTTVARLGSEKEPEMAAEQAPPAP